jgi:hypothetical protein
MGWRSLSRLMVRSVACMSVTGTFNPDFLTMQ